MCEPGYSPTSPTDNTCVRDCAPGNGDPIYYSDGNLCWPVCPSTTIDIGPSCTKKSYTRQPNLWISPILYTDLLGNKVCQRTDDNGTTPSSKPGCPPGFQAIKSTTQNYQPANNQKVVSCYPMCIDIKLWDSRNNYAIGDYASFNQISYIAINNIVGNLSNLNPSLDSTNWNQKTTDLILSEFGNCYNAICPRNETNNNTLFIPDTDPLAPIGTCLRGDYNGVGGPFNPPGPPTPLNPGAGGPFPPDMAITRTVYLPLGCRNGKRYSIYTYSGTTNDIQNIIGETRLTHIFPGYIGTDPNYDNLFKCSYDCNDPGDIRLPNMKCYNPTTQQVGTFSDPVLEEPEDCGNSGQSQWGQSKITPDVSGLGPGLSDEYRVRSVIMAIGAQVWVPSFVDEDGIPGYKSYNLNDPINVDDVVCLFVDQRQWCYFDETGAFHPTVESDPRATLSPFYLKGIAPFFRCINNGTQARPNWTQPDPNTVPNGLFSYAADGEGPFSPSDFPPDSNWTYANISNSKFYTNAVRFGDRKFKSELCSSVSGFCPISCITDCPDPINPVTQEGFYEKDFRYTGGPFDPGTILAAVCYPRCSPGNYWRSQSSVCAPYTPGRVEQFIPGYSYCPIRLNLISHPTYSNLFGTNLEQPSDGICMTPCDVGYEIKNENPYNVCIASCNVDISTTLLDAGDRCNKIPYKKVQQPSQADNVVDFITRTEDNLDRTASIITKISLQNGVSNLIYIVGFLALLCLAIAIFLILVRRNQARRGL